MGRAFLPLTLSEIFMQEPSTIQKLSRGRQANHFPTYPFLKFHFGDKLIVRNHAKDVHNLKYDVAYNVVQVIGQQLESIDEN